MFWGYSPLNSSESKNLNIYFFKESKINLKNNEILGKEVLVEFEDSFFGNSENDPILKGKSATSDNDSTKIYKTAFSTCSKENKNCRGWELSLIHIWRCRRAI